MNRSRLQFAVALALSMLMPSDRWVPLSNGEEEHRDYLDRESIQRSGSKVTLWTRRNYVARQRTAWNEIEVDCLQKRDTILAYVQDDGGTVSHNIVRPHRHSTAIPPNSAQEKIFEFVCR
jgi:hypothetical protein